MTVKCHCQIVKVDFEAGYATAIAIIISAFGKVCNAMWQKCIWDFGKADRFCLARVLDKICESIRVLFRSHPLRCVGCYFWSHLIRAILQRGPSSHALYLPHALVHRWATGGKQRCARLR